MRWIVAFILLSGQAFAQGANNLPTVLPYLLLQGGITPTLTLNKLTTVGGPLTSNIIAFQNNGLFRWQILPGDANIENGLNSGSDFAINSYSDAGVVMDTPFSIKRSSSLITMANIASIEPAQQPVAFAGLNEFSAVYNNITAASATIPEIAVYDQMVASTGSASGNVPNSSAFKMGHAVQVHGEVGSANLYGETIAVIQDASVGNFTMEGLELDLNNNNVDFPEGGASGAVGLGISILTASTFPIAAAINMGTVNTSTYAFHDGIYIPPNAWTIKDNTVHDASSAITSYNDSGTHSGSGISESATTPIGVFTSGVHSTAAFQDSSTATTPWGMILGGTYSVGGLQVDNQVSLTSAVGGAQLSVGTKATSSTTPTVLVLDGSYSSTTGAAHPKIEFLGVGGGYGMGVEAGALDINGPALQFFISSVNTAGVGSNGFTTSKSYLNTGAVPTLSACGTSPPAATAGSSNAAGQFTVGTGGTVTACTVTFAVAYPTTAFCTVSPVSSTITAVRISAQSKTAFTVTFAPATASQIFQYTCGGN